MVNLDPHRKQNSFIDVPIDQFGPMESDTYQVHDLLSDMRYTWQGGEITWSSIRRSSLRMSSGSGAGQVAIILFSNWDAESKGSRSCHAFASALSAAYL